MQCPGMDTIANDRIVQAGYCARITCSARIQGRAVEPTKQNSLTIQMGWSKSNTMVCISLGSGIKIQTHTKKIKTTMVRPVETLGRSSITLGVKFILHCLFSWHLIFPRCAVGDYIFPLNCLIKTFLKHSFGVQSSSDAQLVSSVTHTVRENLYEVVCSSWC